MHVDRRTVLRAVPAVAVAIPGCLEETGDDPSETNGSSPDETTPRTNGFTPENDTSSDGILDRLAEPDPVVESVTHAEPRVISTTDRYIDGDTSEFTIELQNTGTAGEITATFVWMGSEMDDPYSPFAETAATKTRYFDANERRRISFVQDHHVLYTAYGFRLWAANITGVVRNDGGDGIVDVDLVVDRTTIDSKSVTMDADETTSVLFSDDYTEYSPGTIDIEATFSNPYDEQS